MSGEQATEAGDPEQWVADEAWRRAVDSTPVFGEYAPQGSVTKFGYEFAVPEEYFGKVTHADDNAPTSTDAQAGEVDEQTPDMVAHPSHYTSSPARCKGCGRPIECIDITEHMGFCLGNATKYVWRCDLKNDAIEDLRKAIQYIEFEIARRQAEATTINK